MSLYTVLPSNSCSLTQPENHASRYIVDWETALLLPGKWEVALTEFTFIYTPTITTVNSKLYFVKQGRQSEEFQLEIEDGILLAEQITYGSVRLDLKNDKLAIYCDNVPYSIIFDSVEGANVFGFDNIVTVSNKSQYWCDKAINLSSSIFTILLIENENLNPKEEAITFNEYLLFPDTEQLNEYFIKHCAKIFLKFDIDQNGLIYFKLQDDIVKITIDHSLADILGFSTKKFKNKVGRTFKAKQKPKLESTFNQMYIYSSIIKPILVGGVNVPLLRSIWIESKYHHGDVVHENIDQLMYLPVSSSSINNIEIEIRNDSGQLLNFPFGSKTSLVLHFRKQNE